MSLDSIQIQIRYFAIVREAVGKSEEARTVPAGTTAGELLDELVRETPRLGTMRRSLMLMVNQEYVDSDAVLLDGAEFVMIPPVSGGAIEEPGRLFKITDAVLDPREVERVVASGDAGAIVTFTGVVRNHGRGRAVSALEYEAYAPAAEKMLAQVGEEIREKWGLERVAIVHRTGLLPVGEASVVIAISSTHRDEAFEASKYAIVRLKEIVPIWKKEFYEDGATWLGSESDYQCEIGRLPNTNT